MSDRRISAWTWTARIEQSCPDGSQATSLSFSVPTEWSYRAGQYVTITTPAGPRHYSIASNPRFDQVPYITVKGTGVAGRYLCEKDRVHDELTFSGPHGDFVLRDATRPLFFFGAGSGMVPLASMAIDASYDEGPPIVVVGAYADSSSAIALTSLGTRASETTAARSVTIHSWHSSTAGLPTAKDLASYIVSDTAKAHAYVCGPQGFVDLATKACVSAGIDASTIFTEGYS